jgi:hypothetical protein
MRRLVLRFVGLALALLGLVAIASAESTLSDSLKEELRGAKYVYISSTRKDGSLGRPAEIWFFYHDGAVYVGTRPASWRVKRIKAGRPAAKIWIGKPNGPSMFQASEADLKGLSSFEAMGSVVDDTKIHEAMFEAFAEKYPDGWPTHEKGFRTGFKDGSRMLVKYVPK